MPKRRRVERMAETVPLFDKLVCLKYKDDAIRARSRSGSMEREGAMTKSLFLKLVIKGFCLLTDIGFMPTFTTLGKIEEQPDGRYKFRLGFSKDMLIEGFVTREVLECARDQLNRMIPINVVRFAEARGR